VTLATTTGPDDDREAEVERLVLDAELVDRPRAGWQTAPTPPIRRAAQVARRQAVHVVTTVATHDRTKTTAKATGRHLWFPIAGAGVAVKRWRDAHGANRYERMMRAAEVAGDREQLLEWEARDVAEKQRRHDRVMDWVRSPLLLAKAVGIGVASVAVLLLGLGVILALAEGDASRVLGPIVGVIEAVRWTAWFLAAYGVLLLLGGTAGGIAYLWHLGRTRATVPAWIASPTADVRSVVPDEGAIVGALRNLGLPALNRKVKEGWVPRWVSPTTRDGKGWHTQLELPPGVTVEMVNDRKPVLAHNLVRKPVEVWAIEPRKLPGVLDLWVADQGVLTDPVAPWPLLEDGDADYFKGVPVGVDPRGDVVIGKLMASNYGIAGIMGSGKTSLVINLVCGAMLDPLVDIDVYVTAFNVDYDPMRRRLRTLVKGDEDEQIEAAIEALRGLRSEVTARGKLLAELGGEETKVTRELAERDARLRPRLVIFDECQEMFRHERYGDEAKELAIKVMMKARKCAITLGFITPAPAADSLPRDLAKTVSHGVCFAIGDHQGNDAILGTGAHKSGVSATSLVAGEDVGTAMAKGFGPKAGLLRTHHIRKDKAVDQITPIVDRALALRDGAGIGTAPAVEAAGKVADPLADIAAALTGHKRLRTQEVLSLLAARDRAAYGRWTFERLADALPEEAKPYKSGGVMVVSSARVAEALADRELADSATDGDDEDGSLTFGQ
jgi:S-DNA-T family DNA segregation ATPase FtsK/SpoIIIE